MKITTIIILVLLLLVIISSVCVYFFFKAKIENLSMTLFGTKNILDGFKKQELEYQNTHKSVSSLDSVIKPKILKDFPYIDFEELKSLSENSLNLYFESLSKKEIQTINNSNDNLNNKIQIKIDDLKSNKESISNFVIHRTVLNSYSNKEGACIITFQSSVEYLKKTKKNTIKVQDRYNTDLIYVYDEKHINGAYGVSLNCQNCGAPIKELGTKNCPYCETGVIEYTTKVWKVNDIYQK